jgi:hypothetical protein
VASRPEVGKRAQQAVMTNASAAGRRHDLEAAGSILAVHDQSVRGKLNGIAG